MNDKLAISNKELIFPKQENNILKIKDLVLNEDYEY
jgi:hypothetical protein